MNFTVKIDRFAEISAPLLRTGNGDRAHELKPGGYHTDEHSALHLALNAKIVRRTAMR
ncbi:MAG: hypothetical protein ACLTDS_13065 [Bianqueaceae bacterium]